MPDAHPLNRQSLGVTALVAVFLLAIVVGPFLMVGDANRRVLAASTAVTHTREVEAALQELMHDLHNREAATLAYAYGIDTDAIRERQSESRRQIPLHLARLRALTHSSPDQQLRVGRLTSIIEQRGQTSDAILARPAGRPDFRDINWMVDRISLRIISAEMSSEELRLLKLRTAETTRLGVRREVLAWIAMATQLMLLGVLAWLLARQAHNRRVAEAIAARSSARAQAVLETVREPVVVLDQDLRVVLRNPAFAEVFGADVAVLGKTIDTVGPGAGAWAGPEIRQRLANVLARDRELWDYEVAYRDPDGRERTLLMNARRMSLPERSDDVALITANDITAHKVAERQVRELNRQLVGKVDQVSEVNRELEAFSYSVSHDLRAPLRHIGGFADKLGRHLGASDEKTTHYLNTISSSARRMSRLIDDLLVYSRLGRSALRLQAVDLQSLVEETRSMLDANAAQDHPGHHITWRIAPLPILVGDDNMLRQVWLNLLSNAVKYSARVEPAVIEVTYQRQDDGDYRFEVADNGVGFDMAYAGKLFGVFQRLHSVSEFDGTGIGLATVRRVLARHGGRIWAESTPGEGARFLFTLPTTGESIPSDTTP